MRVHPAASGFLRLKHLAKFFALTSFISLTPGAWCAQQAGGVQASGPKVKMVRSVAGSKGDSRGNSFVMADPRTTFYVPDDKQVIVYFEWDAAVGTHHCEGTLRGPNGQLAVMSSFDYPATQTKFGGFWTFPLTENTPAGVWTFESHVDGESAGTLSFEIVSARKPATTGNEEALPTAAQIYARAQAATVRIEKLDAKGQSFGGGSGFFLGDDLLITAFRVIDAAHTLRLTLPDGTRRQSTQVAAWNRRQDWVILQIDGGKTSKLTRAPAENATIGDHCYWLDTKTDGGRVISDGQIVGKDSHPGWGDRISLSGLFNSEAIGGPVFNDRGEVLGLLGGTLPESLVPSVAADAQRYSSDGMIFSATGSVIPISLVPLNSKSAPGSLESLWTSGQFTPPVTASRQVMFGMVTRGKPEKKDRTIINKEMNLNLARQDETATVIVSFQGGGGAWRGGVQLQITDADNHSVVTGPPVKLSLGKGEVQERSWTFTLGSMRPGVYRADALIGDEVAWRRYFRIRD
jgi:S1-C subfamily serine protease